MQTDLDTYLVTYNTKRHERQAPANVFARCLPKTKKPKEDKLGKAA